MSTFIRLLLVAAIAGCGGGSPRRDVVPALAGTWGWTKDPARSCKANPHTLAFSADRHFLILRHRAPIETYDGSSRIEAYYRVLQIHKNSVTLLLEGETRRQRDGRPISFELRLLSDTAYCWHRTDKSSRECSPPVVRCRRAD
jgi:hypothetical protein